MDMNNVSTRSGKDGSRPAIARCVHILLVLHNVTSLMLLASRFKHQEYQVTTAGSATSALATLKKRKSNHNIVIADYDIPGMEIYEFVRKVHHQRMTIPVILMAEDVTTELVREAFSNGVCYLFSKPPSDSDIIYTWQHIYRVTGELPALTDGENGNPSNGSSHGGAAINRKPRNMKRKIINTDEENETDEDDGINPKKSCMTWTTSLQAKFLEAVNILGVHSAHPNSILGMMKEPGLTLSQVSSHLQLYRNIRKRLRTNPQEIASPVMTAVLPSVPFGISKKEQTSYTTNTNFTARRGALQIPRSPIWLHASNFVAYTIEDVKRKLDALNYSGNNTMKTISKNGGVQVGEGSGGVQAAQAIDPKHKSNKNANTNIAPLFLQNFAHMTMEGSHEIQACADVRNRFQAPNVELAGVQVAQGDGAKTADQDTDQNYTSNENAYARGKAPLVPQCFSHGMQSSSHPTNGLQDPNKEQKGDLIESGMFGFGNVGNLANRNHANFGEGPSGANQQFSEISGNDDINKIIQELETSEVDLWDLILHKPE